MARRFSPWVWIAFVAICIIWGTTYPGVKIAMRYFPPFFFSGVRHFFAGCLFLSYFVLKKEKLPTLRELLIITPPAFLMIIGGNALLAWGIQYIPSGFSSVLSALAPMYVVFFSFIFFKDFRISTLIWVGMFLSIGGISALSLANGKVSIENPNDFWFGVSITIFANICWALATVFIKRYSVEMHIFKRTGWQMLIAGIVNFIISGIFEVQPDLLHQPFEAWEATIYLVLVGSLGGYLCFAYLLDKMSAARMSIHVYVNTVVAVLLGWLFLGETLTLFMWLCLGVIMLGVVLINNEYARLSKG